MRAIISMCLVLALGACGLPRDPRGTLDRVSGGQLRVGLVSPDRQQDADRRRLAAFADSLEATLQVSSAATHEAMDALERGELDLVASLPAQTPFKSAGLTRTYYGEKGEERVWAVRPGENAFLISADAYLHESSAP